MITVNGEQWQAQPGMTIADVVARLTQEPRGIAVALDGAVIPRPQWTQTTVDDNAQIEVLTAVQGG